MLVVAHGAEGRNIMPERFTETLRTASKPTWSQAVGRRFVKELFGGTVPDAVMAHYLIQDHRFFDSFLTLLGPALASADTFEAAYADWAWRTPTGGKDGFWRGDVLHRLLDDPGGAGPGAGGPRLRVGMGTRALAHT